MRSTKDAVSDAGERVASKARANLASRRDRNRHSIETEQGIVDYYVHLVGPGALSLELGHHNNRSGEWVEGARILRDALGGA